MRIEQLEVSGLRSHRGNPPTCLDLRDKSLVAIVGHTGAGKSSLLEAITFALFGEATYGGKAYGELSSDGRCEISVRIIFTVGDDRYQLVRVVGPNRNGVFGAKEIWLRRIDAAGNALAHIDGVRNVDAKVSGLLGGIGREQFCQAVLLAQNRFAALLEADPRVRNNLLDTLLGLTALHKARDGLRTVSKAASRNIERLQTRRSVLPPDPAADARHAKATAGAMASLASHAGAGATRLTELSTTADRLTREAEELARVAAMRASADGPDGLARLDQVVSSLVALTTLDEQLANDARLAAAALDAARHRVEEAERSLAAVQKVHGTASTHPIAATRLQQLGALLDEQPALAAKHLAAAETVATLVTEMQAATKAAKTFTQIFDQLAEAAHTEREDCQSQSETLRKAEQDLDAAAAAAARLGAQVERLYPAVSTLSSAGATLRELESELAPLLEQQQAAAMALDAARREDAAALAAHNCQSGDPCPICGTELPAGWLAPGSGDLGSAEKSLQKAERASAKASDSQRKASEKLVSALATLRAELSGVISAHEALREATQLSTRDGVPELTPSLKPNDKDTPAAALVAAVAAAAALRVDVDTWIAMRREALVPERHMLAASQTRVAKANELAATAGSDKAAADATVQRLNTNMAAATSTCDATERAINEADQRMRNALDGIDERWRAIIDLTDTSTLADASATLAADRATVDAAVKEQSGAAGDHAATEKRVQAVAADRGRRVDAPLGVARATLATLTDLANDLAALLGEPDAEAPAPTGGADRLLASAAELVSTAQRMRNGAATRIAALYAEVGQLARPADEVVITLIDEMNKADPDGSRLGERPDTVDSLGASTRNRVHQIVGAANRLASEATEAAKTAEDAIRAATELDARIKALTSWRVDLNGAIDVLRKDGFPAWARNLRVADLVDTSSELLAEMTCGRYRFDSNLLISDEIAGIVRKPSTLSGGEKFEASLALALGVSEIAGRSGIRVDTLFLDEGFASLDQAHLNRALDTLENQVEAGRCIVLITHIGSVADRIKDVLLIEPDGAGGSSTRWLNEEERFELGADLDLAVP